MRRVFNQFLATIAAWTIAASFADAQESQKSITYDQLKACLTTPPNNFKEGDDFVRASPTSVDYFTNAALEAGRNCIAGKRADQRQTLPDPEREAKEQADLNVALELLDDVFHRVRNEHVDPVDTEKMFGGAIDGLLKLLPDLANEPELLKARQAVSRAASGSAGDQFTSSLDALLDLLEHARKGKPPRITDKNLVRWAIAGMLAAVDADAAYLTPDGQFQHSASPPARPPKAAGPPVIRSEGGAIIVRLPSFNEHTAAALERDIGRERRRQSGRSTGMVLDLRGNSGAGIRDVILIADLFLDNGVVASTKGRTPESSETVYASSGDVAGGMKLVVLIDADTVAGAEIIAAAIKDSGRGTLVGQRSAGLTSITSIIPLKHNHALRMTTARWVRPNGATGAAGIMPDIEVAQTGEGDAQLAAALALATKQ